jgi:hypothetical protein
MTSKKTKEHHTMTAPDLAYADALAARDAYDLAYADARDGLTDARRRLTDANTTFNAAYAAARDGRAAYARAAYAAAHDVTPTSDATPTSDLIKASPALLSAARLALDYLETLPHQPSIHPSTKAQDALHDAIVAAQGLPT